MQRLRDEGVRSFALVPLTTAQRRLGAMGFGRIIPRRITADDGELAFMKRVACQVAVAVDNALNLENFAGLSNAARARTRSPPRPPRSQQRPRHQPRDHPNSSAASSPRSSASFITTTPASRCSIPPAACSKFTRSIFPAASRLIKPELTIPRESSPAGRAIIENRTLISRGAEMDQYSSEVVRLLRSEGMQIICCIPLTNRGRTFGTLNLASRRTDGFTPADIELVQQVAAQIAIAVENALAFKQIDALKTKLAEEKLYLEEEIRSAYNFEEIVGDSPAIRRVMAQVELVAPAGSTVLILGETGTGKEVIARAVHNLSPRKERTFVKVNCAAIPSGLLEAELFGHERGAFTGAINQKIGRFELADRGTLFLDEIGDIPLELQPKLLRVLQEQEFERLGSNRTQTVDVRVVAATNRDLTRLVADREFRSDLYYRLNVFPIQIPPLRERREDVPLLVRYFVQNFSRRLNKTVQYVPADAMDALVNYSWPGNIRELENLIERAVLLSPGKELRVPLAELKQATLSVSDVSTDIPSDGSIFSPPHPGGIPRRASRHARRSRAPTHSPRSASNRMAHRRPQRRRRRPRHEAHHPPSPHAQTQHPPPNLKSPHQFMYGRSTAAPQLAQPSDLQPQSVFRRFLRAPQRSPPSALSHVFSRFSPLTSFLLRSAPPRHHPLHHRKQIPRLYRLRQILIHPRPNASLPIPRHRIRRQRNDRNPRPTSRNPLPFANAR